MTAIRIPVFATALVASAFGCSRSTPSPPSRPAPTVSAAAPAAAPGRTSPSTLRVESAPRDTLANVGDPVPTFHAVASNGQAVDIAPGARAHALVVYFYPRDETPGCTIEAEAFRDAHDVYETSGIDVVGVSTDDDAAHRGFTSNHNLQFPLVADPEGRVAAAFGVRVNNGYAQRTTFVVDRQGHVARVFSPVQPRGHADEVIAAVRALGPSA